MIEPGEVTLRRREIGARSTPHGPLGLCGIVLRCHSIRVPRALAYHVSLAGRSDVRLPDSVCSGFRVCPIAASSVVAWFECRNRADDRHVFVENLESHGDEPVCVNVAEDQIIKIMFAWPEPLAQHDRCRPAPLTIGHFMSNMAIRGP